MTASPPDGPEPGLLPVRRSARRFAFATAVAVWGLYLAMAGVRCVAYGFKYPLMLMERHGLTALVAIALSFCLYALLDRHRSRDMSRQLALALLATVPPAAILSVINYNVMFVFVPDYYLRAIGIDAKPSFVGEVLDSLTGNYFVFAAWAVLLTAVGHDMRSRETLRRAAATEAAARAAELRALRLQLDPHFLFNALNTVSGLIMAGDADRAERTVDALSAFLRASLVGNATSDIPLAEELQLQMLYLQIEQVRFGERLQVHSDVPDDLLDCAVPAMILQPIMENAVRHAVARTARPVWIFVTARRDADQLVLTIDNDGPAGAAEGGHGLGLANITARLSLRYDHRARFEFRPRPGRGVSNRLSLPLETNVPAVVPPA